MKTTVNLGDELLKAAKQRAAAQDRTLTNLLDEALRRVLAEPPPGHTPPIRLTTFSGGPGAGPRPGVDLDDSAGLLEIMSLDEVAPADADS